MIDQADQQSSQDSASRPRARFRDRFAAGLIDVLALVALTLVPTLAFGLSHNASTGVMLVLIVLYTAVLEGGQRGQSLGKRALGIRVVDAGTGGPIGFGRGVVRGIVGIISGFPGNIGYFWMIWDRDRQTWHDKLSSSYVVPVSAYPIASSGQAPRGDAHTRDDLAA